MVDFLSSLKIAATGLHAQNARMRVIAENLANADSTSQTPGGDPLVVISSRFWQRGFGNDPAILGRSLKLNGTTFTVIGVTPEDFTGTTVEVALPDFWAPI